MISIAPMLAVTDRHFRMFMRVLTKRAMLYTEMKTCAAILRGDRDAHLAFDPRERPVGIQLGGADPDELAECARLAEQAGYDEINLNVGCPSARVKSGAFGACLMAEPRRVARAVAAMRAATEIPITVKTRIGIDDLDSYAHLAKFVECAAGGGCRHFIVHARCAWLQGVSPKENRTLPPLNYPRVYRLARAFPQLRFTINGGLQNLDDAAAHLHYVQGAMFGRAALQNPWLLRTVDARFYRAPRVAAHTRAQAVHAYLPYVKRQLAGGVALRHMAKPLLGLYYARPRARLWRRYLCERGARPKAGAEVLLQALRLVSAEARLAAAREPRATMYNPEELKFRARGGRELSPRTFVQHINHEANN